MSDLKKILIPRQKYAREAIPLISLPTVIESTIAILDEQVEKLRLKSRNATFDEKDARILQAYIKSLIDLSKEERDREKEDDFAKQLGTMTSEQLLEMYQQKVEDLKK
jgi:hypothetical protein